MSLKTEMSWSLKSNLQLSAVIFKIERKGNLSHSLEIFLEV